MARHILHVDQNCFYASVEMQRHPELRDKPLAVCGSQEERHGIVLTANYLAKPYDLEVLAARVEARLRQERTRSRYVSYGNLRLDTLSGCGYLGDTDLLLTQKEFAVLLLLVHNAGKPVPAQKVLREVWNAETEDDNRALWTLISRLRRKLNSEVSRIEISSKRGDGYVLEQI